MRRCPRCSNELAPGALVCGHCQALVYSAQLEALAAQAQALETRGEWLRAREQWLVGLQFLPPTSTQADWIKGHARELESAAAGAQSSLVHPNQRVQPLGLSPAASAAPGPTSVAVQPKFRWTFLLSFVAFVLIYSAASGVTFGIGFAVLILIHEMGHFVDIKRRGLPADMPVFLPGLGAYVRWQALGVSLKTRSQVSLAGPLAGLLAAVVCAAIWWQTKNPVWASLARIGAILNLLNLIPLWILDGGQAVLALSKVERIGLLAASIALGVVLKQQMFILVALGVAYQAFFAKNLPAQSSRSTTVYYVAVLAALGLLIRLMPGQGLGFQ
jgi:Zn-dependent protease